MAEQTPYGPKSEVSYADPGYQSDKKARYPIDSRAHAKAAWAYVQQKDNARLYTSAQLKRIKGRIMKALKGFGVQVAAQEGWLIEPAAQVTEALAECWGMDAAAPAGNLYLSLTNGPTTVTVSSSLVDTHDLGLVGRAAMAGACDALLQLDPDMDADIDVPGADAEDTDADMGHAATAAGAACPCGCGCAIPQVPGDCPCPCAEGQCLHCMGEDDDSSDAMESTFRAVMAAAGADIAPGVADGIPQTPATSPAAEIPIQDKEPAMAESTPTPAGETPGTDNGIADLSAKFDKLTDAITGLVTKMAPAPAVEAAPAAAAPVAETAPAPVAETEDQRIARLVEAAVQTRLTEAVQQHVEQNGPPTRKGLVPQVTEHTAPTAGTGLNSQGVPADWPDKPLHTYSDEERARYFGPAMEDHVFGHRTR